ncbi:hypothetical protein DJICPGNB_05480 [Escherichia coli]|nr:hypothetical protein DJICPGNB_05480 [Escherichia coli]
MEWVVMTGNLMLSHGDYHLLMTRNGKNMVSSQNQVKICM